MGFGFGDDCGIVNVLQNQILNQKRITDGTLELLGDAIDLMVAEGNCYEPTPCPYGGGCDTVQLRDCEFGYSPKAQLKERLDELLVGCTGFTH